MRGNSKNSGSLQFRFFHQLTTYARKREYNIKTELIAILSPDRDRRFLFSQTKKSRIKNIFYNSRYREEVVKRFSQGSE